MSKGLVLRGAGAKIEGRVEIARSFSFKLNINGTVFFCSQKAECDAEDAEEIAERLYQFCKASVLRSVREYQESQLTRAPGRKIA